MQSVLGEELRYGAMPLDPETGSPRRGKDQENSYFLPAAFTDIVGSAPVHVTSDVAP